MGHDELDVVVTVVQKGEAEGFVRQLHTRPSLAVGLLLGGDRWACVTDAALAKIAETTVGIATLAPQGEGNTGAPTVVGLYVLPEYRRHGVGDKLLVAAVGWLRDLVPGTPVRLDVMHSAIMRMIARLPHKLRENLDVRDQTMGGMMDAILEA